MGEWTRESMAQRLQESAEFLEGLHENDRARARQKFTTAPHTLSDHDRHVLGLDVVQPRPASPKPPVPSPRDLVAAAVCPTGITFRTPFLQRLNNHAIDLAVRHKITVIRRNDGWGFAHQESREIEVAAVTNESTYATFLHETGHVVDPDGDSRQYPYTLKSDNGTRHHHLHLISPSGEVGAWRWAVNNVLVWTVEMQECLYGGLKSYVNAATPDERCDMARLLTSACARVTGKTWSFAELDERCAALRGTHGER